MSNFVHLHNHSHFSLLDAMSKIDDLVKRTKDLDMNAVALTDHGNMSGAVQLWKRCKKDHIKAIIGCELYVATGSRLTKRKTKDSKEKNYHHLVVWAKSKEGYQNLCRLVAASYLDGFYYKPRVDEELLKLHHRGLVASTACLAGAVPRALLYDKNGMLESSSEEAVRRAATYVRNLQNIFEDQVYLELQDHGAEEQVLVNTRLVDLAKATGAKLIWTNDCHFLTKDDYEAHADLKCIPGYKQSNSKEFKEEHGKIYRTTHHFRSEDEMRIIPHQVSGPVGQAKPRYPAEIIPQLVEAFDRTMEVAEACDFSFTSSKAGTYYFPEIPREENQTLEEQFRAKTFEGFQERVNEGLVNPDRYGEYIDRLLYEIKMISTMGFESYFVIVADMVQWAKKQGIPVGPGRGSAAGSIVSWSLQITDLDPVEHGLLFERFLNPARVSMPDIDLDFSKRRRGEVIDYVVQKYGRENVAQIITFHTLAPRRVLNDIGRVEGLPVPDVQKFAAMVPDTPGNPYDLEKTYKEFEEFRALTKSNPLYVKTYAIAQRLEDVNRHAGIHAAGVVITPTPLTDYVPLFQQPNSMDVAAGYDMRDLEEIGLVKMDLLGLKTLDVIADTIQLIQRRHRKDINWHNISLDDKSVYKLFAEGKTKGVFQFESRGMRNDLQLLQPDCFEDITAMNALYRPGPNDAGMTESYIKRKRGEEEAEAFHPAIKEIVAPTYGVLVYQEQIMKAIQVLAGYSLGEADVVRKAMGKKDFDLMKIELDKFIAAAVAKGYPKADMEKVAEAMSKFARYGFNRAHAAAYAYIAYQTAWLLKYYPLEFMCSVLVAEAEDNKFEKIREYVADVKRMGISVLPPNVNSSDVMFSVEGNAIRYGLAAIKGIGPEAAESIIEERSRGGFFQSFVDFLFRVRPGKGLVEPLISAGATECLFMETWEDRATHLENHVEILKAFKKNQQAKGQTSIFSAADQEDLRREAYQLKRVAVKSPKLVAEEEKKVLGLWLTKHPLDTYKGVLADDIASLKDAAEMSLKGFKAEVVCVVEEVVYRNTVTGKKLGILKVEDLTAESDEFKIWGDEDIAAMEKALQPGAIVRLIGKAGKDRSGRFQFNVRAARRLDPVEEPVLETK